MERGRRYSTALLHRAEDAGQRQEAEIGVGVPGAPGGAGGLHLIAEGGGKRGFRRDRPRGEIGYPMFTRTQPAVLNE